MAAPPTPGFDPSRIVVETMEALENGSRADALYRFAAVLREGGPESTAPRVERLCTWLEGEPEIAREIGDAIRTWLVFLRVGPALIEAGITPASGFFSELGARVVRRVVPPLEPEGDLRTAVRRLFPDRDVAQRIESVPDAIWVRLMNVLDLTADSVHGVDPELGVAIRAIAHHVGSLGMQPELTDRLPHLEEPDAPFLALTDRVLRYIRSYENDIEGDEPAMLAEALDTVELCREEIRHLRATKSEHGTSLQLTGLTFRLLQLLDRLEVLLHLTDPVQRDFQASAIRLFREIVAAETTRDRIRPLLRERADLLAFQVVEHAARKGSKYITSGRRDYAAFFMASLGGGFIVAVFSLIKTIMGGWYLPLGIEALLYGLNYSLCFVLIYLTGSALATKQPAMTANTIARALGDPSERHLDQLEALVVRVWRSQFVSFVGNLAMALPTAFLLSEIFLRATGATVADDDKAISMLTNLHPWQSGTVAFAAIAGLFLFVAGLVSGWVDNRNLYSRLPERVAKHPVLRITIGEKRARTVGDFLDRNLGVLTGNVFLGFALGSTGTIGEILGLPLDIRHIAFASAEFGTALEVLDFEVAVALVWPVALGVLLIGLVNFVVSFGLSLATGLESRRITWDELRVVLVHLGRRFLRRPMDWFFPPKNAPATPPASQ